MDIYCPTCSEPVDFDELHFIADQRDIGVSKVARDFRARGCNVIDGLPGVCDRTDIGSPDAVFGLTPAQAASALYDILGDDMDGAASMMDDMF